MRGVWAGRGRRRVRWGLAVVAVALAVNYVVALSTTTADPRHPRVTLSGALALVVRSKTHLDDFSATLGGRVVFSRDARQLVPLASTMKVLILDQAAQEIAAGRLNAGTMVPLSTIASTYLPGTDGNAHPEAVAAATARGWVVDHRVSVLHLLDMMIEFSDNAATDTVMRMIDVGQLDHLARRLGQDPPLPPGGLFASWTGVAGVPRHLHRGPAFDREALALALRLHADPGFRRQVETAFTDGSVGLADQTRLTAQLAPRGSAAAYAELMAQIVTGHSAADRIATQVLEWPMRLNPAQARSFSIIAQKGGSLPGTLTVVEVEQLKGHTGYVTALFFHGISPSASAAIQSADAFDIVPLGIAVDPAFRSTAAHALG